MFSQDFLKKRVLIFGANGMLGQRAIHLFTQAGNYEILASSSEPEPFFFGIDYKQVDFTQRDEVKNIILNFYPDIIINTAAYTNVDKAETDRELCWKVNVKGLEFITEAARVVDCHIIHISTDYVFDGTKGPYSEIDIPNPSGYYARTKLASENALKIGGTQYTILRTNVLYGIIKTGRADFVRWVVDSIRNEKPIRIVIDQINNPTFLDDLASAIHKVIEKRKFGLYHIGGREFLSRYEFTLRIADYYNLDKSLVTPIVTAELNQPAPRPLKSGLITIKAESEFGFKPHSIEESFEKMKKELNL
ncbi:MAG: dTDP-4-dehydrorhamnose reductase [Ignavibacteria bacterium]|nr:dTDP-4-dehydrorhamnose reductase [Ignavibacteria bacterium]